MDPSAAPSPNGTRRRAQKRALNQDSRLPKHNPEIKKGMFCEDENDSESQDNIGSGKHETYERLCLSAPVTHTDSRMGTPKIAKVKTIRDKLNVNAFNRIAQANRGKVNVQTVTSEGAVESSTSNHFEIKSQKREQIHQRKITKLFSRHHKEKEVDEVTKSATGFLIDIPLFKKDDIRLTGINLGEGTHSTVELALFRDSFRRLAVKICKPHVRVQNVLREVRLHMKLENSGVAPHCYGVVQDEKKVLWIVMEYIDNSTTLQSYVEENIVTAADALTICINLCKGLKAIHQRGILHNDVKEDNILIDYSTTSLNVKIIDYGLSTDFEGRLLSKGACEKKLPHMAPELFIRCTTSQSTDVFSLWRLFTVVSLFTGYPTPDTMVRYKTRRTNLGRCLNSTLAILEEELGNVVPTS